MARTKARPATPQANGPLNTAIGPTSSNTYSGIAAEQEAIEAELQRRKMGSEVPALEQPPHNPANVWNDIDRGQSDG